MNLILSDPKPLAPVAFVEARPLGVANRFKIQVVERRHNRHRGRVVSSTPWQNNLIHDQGLDRIGSDLVVNLFTYCVIGTGNRATDYPSGVISATTSGAVLTANGAFFVVGDVGNLVRFTTGEKAKITGYTSATQVTLGATLGVGSLTAFTMYDVDATGMDTERTGTGYRNINYLTGTGNCGTTLAGSVLTHRRTWDFPIEVSDQNYSEVGFSHSATVAANINSRALFAGGSVAVLTGQQLRVVYDFVVTLSPTSNRSKKFPITGWPALTFNVTADASTDKISLASHGLAANAEVVFGGSVAPGGITFGTPYYVLADTAGTFKISATVGGSAVDITSAGTSVTMVTNTAGTEVLTLIGMSAITTAGAQTTYETVGGNPNTVNEPSANGFCNISTDASAQLTFPVAGGLSYTGTPTGGSKALTLNSVTSTAGGGRTRTKSVSYTTTEANSSAIRTISMGQTGVASSKMGLRFLFDYPQEKTSINTLSVIFRSTWDRDFS